MTFLVLSWSVLCLPTPGNKPSIVAFGGGHQLVQLQLPEWPILRYFAAVMESWACCHHCGGGGFLWLPSSWILNNLHKMYNKRVVVGIFLELVNSKLSQKWICKINNKQSHIVGAWYTSTMRRRYHNMKNVVECHTFVVIIMTNPFYCVMTASSHCYFQLSRFEHEQSFEDDAESQPRQYPYLPTNWTLPGFAETPPLSSIQIGWYSPRFNVLNKMGFINTKRGDHITKFPRTKVCNQN